jgi:hypothetical protein
VEQKARNVSERAPVLVWDAFKGYLTPVIKDTIGSINMDIMIILGRMIMSYRC